VGEGKRKEPSLTLRAGKAVVTAALLAYVGWNTDWAKVADAFAHLRLTLWLAAVGVLAAVQVVSAWRWQLLARPFGFDRTVRQLACYYFVGMYFNLLLPTSVGGDVVRAWYIDGGEGRRLTAFVTVFLDRFSGLVVLLALGCLGVLLSPLELPAWIPAFVGGTTAAAALAIVLAPWLARRGERFSRQFHKVRIALRTLREPRLLAGSTALSVLVQAGNVVLVWLVGEAVGAELPAGYYWVLVPMVSLVTMLPVSINGMGVRENAVWAFVAPLGVAYETAVCLGLAWFAVFLAASAIGGGVYLLGDFQRPQAESDDGPVSGGADQRRARQPRAAA
jgi:uncharacterized membrane protein YbhN (UPF0104 family)